MGDSMSTIINATTTNGVVIQPDNSGSLVLQTNSGTTALTIDTSQNATFAAQATIPTINLTGGQITFPATAVPSADANTLDDYEEGTFTPIYVQSSTNPTVSYTGTAGFYRKIGSIVYVSGRISTTSVAGGSGSVFIGGLPFTVANLSVDAGSVNIGVSFSWPTNTFPLSGFPNKNTTTLLLATANSSDARAGVDVQITSLASGSPVNGIVFSCWYIASA
jgi:hypothetical protein